MKKLTNLVLCIFCLISSLFSQNMASIKGFIYDSSTEEALGFCQIQLKGTAYGCLSEKNGAFVINKIPEGSYQLLITFYGYDSISENITLKAGQILTRKILLNPNIVILNSIEVSGTTQRSIMETRTSVNSVTPKEIKIMPSIGGQADFAQYLQLLPGVVSTGDQGGQLYIRGGTPIQNMIKLDGMLIFSPFHSIGLFSVFDTEIIQSADVYSGGFGAEFGGRISSVMDITTRDGNKKRISGKIDLGTMSSKILLEGPIFKIKEAAESKRNKAQNVGLNFLLSAKGSYLEQVSKSLYKWMNTELPYTFWDLYGKLNLHTKQGSKFNFFGFNFSDKVNYDIAKYQWNNYGVGTHFLIVPGTSPTLIGGCISYSKYTTSFDDGDIKPRYSSISGFTASLDLTYFIGKDNLKAGLEFQGFNTFYSFWSAINDSVSTTDNTSDIALYIKYKWNYKNKLILEPGFRLQYYAGMNTAYPEPRLALKWNIIKNFRLKLAGGLYSQNYTSATSDRDVVNLFYGFLSSPSSIPDAFDGDTLKHHLQTAQHIVLGFEYEPIPIIKINIEGYFKNFSQLTVLNRYKLYKDDGNHLDFFSKDYMIEKGYAYGGDITFKTEYKHWYFWVVYSLGWVNRYDGVITYPTHFDRRHNLNIVTSYSFGGPKHKFQINLRFNFGTGFPYTQKQAFYPDYDLTENITTDFITSNESLGILLDEYNGSRLPSYHRLDLNFKYQIFLGKRHILEFNLGATNIYNYYNVFYVNRIDNSIIYQLPILPSLGFSWTF